MVNAQNNLTIWEEKTSLTEIKNLFAPKLNALEFAAFVGMGKATDLNPFLREIWSIKYDERSPAQIFIGRDGYRKAAQRNPEYDYHQSDAVYANDEFKVCNGEIVHSYNLAERGRLIGAYCIVKRRNSSKPIYVFVAFQEYNTGKSVWASKPATMIKKVAEAQALRAAFQEQFAGTYHEDEYEKQEPKLLSNNDGLTQTERVKASYKARTETIIEGVLENDSPASEAPNTPVPEESAQKDTAHVEVDSGLAITDESLDMISSLIDEKCLDGQRIASLFKYFEVEKLEDMTEFKAKQCIVFLEKINLKKE